MRVLPVDSQWSAFARRHPDEALACWTGNVADGPEPLVMLADAIARRDWARADHICTRMAWAQAPMFPGGKLENFVDYNIPIAHARLEGSGKVKSGPPRPPYLHAPESYLEGGRETGRRWAGLAAELRSAEAMTA
jgi:4-(2-carboxyphenyl)-2-oxobut-3-enoate aldolase